MKKESKEHELKKNELLAIAKTLFFQKGYDNTTVQDIIDTLGIAKGTFYHYFKSKDELLDTLVDQMTTEMSQRLRPIASAKKNAIEKVLDIFRVGAAYKVENLELFLVLVKTLYRDENQILRDRMFQRSIEKNSPTITRIIRQGIKEGVFTTAYPEHMGEMIINLGRSINESICKTLLHGTMDAKTMSAEMSDKLKMYQDMIERILGAPKNSIHIYVPGEFEKIADYFIKGLQKQETGNIKKRYKMW